jgi:hypothetical protein
MGSRSIAVVIAYLKINKTALFVKAFLRGKISSELGFAIEIAVCSKGFRIHDLRKHLNKMIARENNSFCPGLISRSAHDFFHF